MEFFDDHERPAALLQGVGTAEQEEDPGQEQQNYAGHEEHLRAYHPIRIHHFILKNVFR